MGFYVFDDSVSHFLFFVFFICYFSICVCPVFSDMVKVMSNLFSDTLKVMLSLIFFNIISHIKFSFV